MGPPRLLLTLRIPAATLKVRSGAIADAMVLAGPLPRGELPHFLHGAAGTVARLGSWRREGHHSTAYWRRRVM